MLHLDFEILHSLVIGGTLDHYSPTQSLQGRSVKYYPYFTDEASETGRLSDSPRVTQEVTGRAGIGTEFLIPNPVRGHATCI